MAYECLSTLATHFRGRRILVTGGAGFVGANLIHILLAANCSVDAIIRPGNPAWRLTGLKGALTQHFGDVGDVIQLARVFAVVRPEFVFHLAAPRGTDERARERMLRDNVLGADALMQCVRQYPLVQLVVAGSSLEYAPATKALTELDQIAPLTWHGATKAAASLLYLQAAAQDGLPVTLLRLFHIYGPWESSHRLAPTAIRAALNGTALPLTNGEIRRDWVYVNDVCEALLLAAERAIPGDVFNIGSGVETSNEALVACVESVMGRRVKISGKTLPPRVTDAPHRLADHSRAQRQLGWIPRHDLATGLQQTVAWYMKFPCAWSNPDDTNPMVMY